MPAAKRYSIDVNGNKQITQTYNINAGEAVRGEGLRFRLPPGNKVEITDETLHAAPKSFKALRMGENLHIVFQNADLKASPDVIIEGFYAKGASGVLVGRGSNGKYFEFNAVNGDKVADSAPLTASLSNKSTTPWGDSGAAVEAVASGERAGVGAAPTSAEPVKPVSGSGKGSTAPDLPVASKAPPPPPFEPEAAGSGGGLGTWGWVLGGAAVVGLAAAAGGGGGGGGSSGGGGGGGGGSTGPTVALSGPATIDEAAGTATYTATLSAASTTAVTVNYATAAGTATAGTDFNAVSGKLTFAAGTTTQTFTVPITDDKIVEGAQTYTVSLSGPTNASLGAVASVTTSILDNDVQAVLSVTPAYPSTATIVREGEDAVFTVTLDAAAETATLHTFAVGGTTTAPADRGAPTFSDGVTYDANTGKITVPAGVVRFTVTIPTKSGDGFEILDETIVVTVDTDATKGQILVRNVDSIFSADTPASTTVASVTDSTSGGDSLNLHAGPGGDLIDLSGFLGQGATVLGASPEGQLTAIAGSGTLTGNHVFEIALDTGATPASAQQIADALSSLHLEDGSHQVVVVLNPSDTSHAQVAFIEEAAGDVNTTVQATEIVGQSTLVFAAGTTVEDLVVQNFGLTPVTGA